MVCVYGLALENETSALSLVREIRKGDPRVSLIAALGDDEAGLRVIDILIGETILFDPSAVFEGVTTPDGASRHMDRSVIREILGSYSDIKAFVFAPEALGDDFLLSEGLSALEATAHKPVMVSVGECAGHGMDLSIVDTRPESPDEDTAYVILDEKVLMKGSAVRELPWVSDAASVITMFSQKDVFGSVLEAPTLCLSRL